MVYFIAIPETMKPVVRQSVISASELQARKDAVRAKNLADFKAGVPGKDIARRNGCLPVEAIRKARIIFA